MLEMTLGPRTQPAAGQSRSRPYYMVSSPVLLGGLALLSGLALGYWGYLAGQKMAANEIRVSQASQKMLPKVNCLQYWGGVQDQDNAVKSLQLRRCDEALGIR